MPNLEQSCQNIFVEVSPFGSLSVFMRSLPLLFILLLSSCRPSPVSPVQWDLLDDKKAALWVPSCIPDEGSISVTHGELTMSAGQPMTGCKFPSWTELGLPGTSYSISYEAMREEGDDIFAMCTFPVSSHEAHATFVLGGWGGTVTGISSIDFSDANENSTRGEMRYENGLWYRVRIEVRPEDIRAWINDRPMVNVSIKGRKVGLRPGFIDHCLPFGFATWNTVGKVRKVTVSVIR